MHARAMMPETSRYTFRVEKDAVKASRDTEQYSGQQVDVIVDAPAAPPMSTRQFLSAWWIPLLGCCGSWFFLDSTWGKHELTRKMRWQMYSLHYVQSRSTAKISSKKTCLRQLVSIIVATTACSEACTHERGRSLVVAASIV